MSLSNEWRDVKYKEVFEQETRGLIRRQQSSSGISADDIKGHLKNLYIMDGADQGGRGPLQDVIMAATIAAYEKFLSELK